MTKNFKKPKAKRAPGETKAKTDTPTAVSYPDFAARSKKIFGNRILTVVDDVIKDRGRY